MIVGLVLFILAFITLLNHIMGQLYFFTLDPSKAVAQDISTRILTTLATPGRVEMVYRNITQDISYSFTDSDRVFCVDATSQIAEIWSTDCASIPFQLDLERDSTSSFELRIEKEYDLLKEKPRVEVAWLS